VKKLKVGGVPEHFNLPWHLAMKSGFSQKGLDVKWTDFHTGTGEMVKALASNELDVAIVLTEGMVHAINNGNPARMLACFVKSPLNWGIHVNSISPLTEPDQLMTSKIAISRFGSGSHLMASYYFQKMGRKLFNDDFLIVNHLEGAREALSKQDNLVFLWEQFTTQFLVNRGEFRRVDVCPTPWPCFMIAVSPFAMERKRVELGTMLEVIKREIKMMLQMKDLSELFASLYSMTISEAEKWLTTVQWDENGDQNLLDIMNLTQKMLLELGLVNQIVEPSDYLVF